MSDTDARPDGTAVQADPRCEHPREADTGLTDSGNAWKRRNVLRATPAMWAPLTPRSLWRDHRLLIVACCLSAVPRALAVLAFKPALLTSDSFLYMYEATRFSLGSIRPAGYSLFLSLFRVLPHPLLFVMIAQHMLGMAVAVVVYAVLRYWRLPAWGAVLAAVPTLFDAREVALESYILPDTVYCAVLITVVALLLTRSRPGVWRCTAVGLAMAYVTVVRGNGLPLAIVVACFLLVRKPTWRALGAASAAFAMPVAGYVAAYHGATGQFNITSSEGIFLWSRTTSFANCAIIKPPPVLRPLCPSSQPRIHRPAEAPAWSVSYLLSEPSPARYLWAPNVWWRHDAHPGFNAYNDSLGLRFAAEAIKAQPADYLKVCARDLLLTFVATDRPVSHATMTFTKKPHRPWIPARFKRYISRYAGTTSNTHPVYPYAYFLFLYQQPVYFPGLIFLLAVLTGMAAVLARWRRWGGLPALPWFLAAVSIVTPTLVAQSLYRYIMVAIPLSCLAAGLAFAPSVRGDGPGSSGQDGVDVVPVGLHLDGAIAPSAR